MGAVNCCAADDGHEVSANNSAYRDDEKLASQEPPAKEMDILIEKTGVDEPLGMDVRHIRGRLKVIKIMVGGAVDRANKQALVRPVEGSRPQQLQLDDTIVSVNGIGETDAEMVAECKRSLKLNVRFLRRS
eukprot:TRINITY_DN77662_c0_g1_i1.p1 TRINITY_DN77662_c0_g1~~TRINITY_DN77662_c0_g1_i1.p1  ORF type:complete len:131 (-),score=36.46 TRINITY_DN77662_c0_g1_i1:279-671(-)